MNVSATGESRIEATHRLQREGRWDEASQYRDEVRKRGRAEGKKRQEANEAAWAAMLEQYPPLEVEIPDDDPDEDPDDPAEIAELAARSKDRKTDMSADAMWVYEHLSNSDLTPLDAPSLGAWGLLRLAREDTRWFMGQFFSKISASEKSDREQSGERRGRTGVPMNDRMVAKERRSIAEIKRIISEVQSDVPNVDGALKHLRAAAECASGDSDATLVSHVRAALSLLTS